jgi:hypothetical protein
LPVTRPKTGCAVVVAERGTFSTSLNIACRIHIRDVDRNRALAKLAELLVAPPDVLPPT